MPEKTTRECPCAADAFLYVMGELKGWTGLKAAFHLAHCRTCRQESARLKAAGGRVKRALGQDAIIERPLRKIALNGILVVAATAGVVGLWIVGNAAVRTAIDASRRPTYETVQQQNNQ